MTIETVPIAILLQNLVDSIDCYHLGTYQGWRVMFRDKLDDQQVPALIESLLQHGQRDPICITEYDTPDGQTCWEMGNGHHRLVVMILLGFDTALVDFSSDYSRASEASIREFSREERQYDAASGHEEAKWLARTVLSA